MRERPAQEKDFYQENGFLSVPEFLDRTGLAAWRDVVEAAIHSPACSGSPLTESRVAHHAFLIVRR